MRKASLTSAVQAAGFVMIPSDDLVAGTKPVLVREVDRALGLESDGARGIVSSWWLALGALSFWRRRA